MARKRSVQRAVVGLLALAGLLVGGLGVSLSLAEVSQKGDVRVAVQGKLTPSMLPRRGSAPVAVTIGGHITSTAPGGPPQLREITIAINRHGQLSRQGLPVCRIGHISPSTTREALLACRESLVGEGRFSANVMLPDQSPFPSKGKVLAFNGRLRGKPAILAHVYGTDPVPTSYVLPFLIHRSGEGTFGTMLEASLPRVTGDWGYVTGVSMTLRRLFSRGGRRLSYLSAGCPAPPGFPGVVFPLARVSFAFADGRTLATTLNRTCKVRG